MPPFSVPAPPAPAPRLRAPPGRWTDLRNLYLILAGFVAVLVLLPPEHEYPVIDDWIYAGAVRHLLATGVFQMPDQSQANLVGLAYWGAGWARVLGFSYTTLTYATLALTLPGLLAFYGLLRAVAVPPGGALLGTALLGLNPLFLHLSYSFMTDVPFLALSLIACYGYVRGLQANKPGWLVAAGLFVGWAFLVRQFGVLVPLGFLGYLALEAARTRRPAWRPILAVALVPALVVAGWWLWSRDMPPTSFVQQAAAHRALFLGQPAWIVVFLLRTLAALPLLALFAPLALKIRPARLWLVALAALLIAGGMLWTESLGQAWLDDKAAPFTWQIGPLALPWPAQVFGFGLSGSIVRVGGFDFFEYRQASIWSPEAWHVLFALAVVLAVGLVARLGDGLLDWLWAWRGGRPFSPLAGFYLAGLAIFAAELALGADYFDRYLLAVLPFVIAFVVRGAAGWRWRAWAYSAAALALLAAFTLLLQADFVDHDNARWQAALWLHARVAPVQMGYDWNNVTEYGNGLHEITDLPIPGFRTERTFPYLSRLSGGTTPVVLAQDRADQPAVPP